jgi:hypothetical protein
MTQVNGVLQNSVVNRTGILDTVTENFLIAVY